MSKILIDRAVVEQALEALYEETAWFGPTPKGAAAITALRAALAEPVLNPAPGYCKHCKQYTIEEPLPAEPVQEAVAWTLTRTLTERKTTTNGYLWFSDPVNSSWTPLYAAPPQRPAEPVQEQAKPDHETRAEIAEQQVVQLAEERDHYLNLWLKAKQAEPVQEPVAWRWGYRSVTTGEMDWRGYVEIAAHPNLRSPEIIMEPLYASPPQRRPLTEDAMQKVFRYSFGLCPEPGGFLFRVGRAVEQAHGIGGEG